MEKLQFGKKYSCKKCQKFLFELKEDGYIQAATNKGFSLNSIMFKIKCYCGTEQKFLK